MRVLSNVWGELLAFIIAMILPIKAVLFSVGFLVVFDLITGVLRARKSKQAIVSSRLRDSVSKMLIYQIAVLTGHMVEVVLLEGSVPIVKIVSAAIGLVELKSIYENLNYIQGNNIFKNIIQILGSKSNKD